MQWQGVAIDDMPQLVADVIQAYGLIFLFQRCAQKKKSPNPKEANMHGIRGEDKRPHGSTRAINSIIYSSVQNTCRGRYHVGRITPCSQPMTRLSFAIAYRVTYSTANILAQDL